MGNNLIFLDEFDLDTPIFRIFSFNRLRDIFLTSKLTLVKPSNWDDPFENFILNSIIHSNQNSADLISKRNCFYGQCWSLCRENDAMWRIYSPDKDGVKVKTTIKKLFTPLFTLDPRGQISGSREYNPNTYIGKVQYKSEKFLTKMLSDHILMSYKIFDNRGQASSFMFKRTEFNHEKEIRLIHNFQNYNNSNLFKFDIDPFTLFDEIIFDPRMEESNYFEQSNIIRSYGYLKKIDQSTLYKLKNFTINL